MRYVTGRCRLGGELCAPAVVQLTRSHDAVGQDAWLLLVGMYVVTKDRGRAAIRCKEHTRKSTHAVMALGRVRARTTARPVMPGMYVCRYVCMHDYIVGAMACATMQLDKQDPHQHFPSLVSVLRW